jgi:hypothetical protein
MGKQTNRQTEIRRHIHKNECAEKYVYEWTDGFLLDGHIDGQMNVHMEREKHGQRDGQIDG